MVTTTNTARKPTKTYSKQKKPLVIRNNRSGVVKSSSSTTTRRSLPFTTHRYHSAHIVNYSKHAMRLHLSQQSLDYATSLLKSGKPQEHGGSIHINPQSGELELQEAQNNSRGSDFIDLPPSTLMWHTHPQTCTTKANCGLGMPSSSDVERFIIDAMKHNCFAHLVFAHEGTYVVALKRAIRRDLARKSSDQQAAYAKHVAGDFAKVQKQFQDNFENVNYKQFASYWMSFANRHSIDVMFFPKGMIPRFTIRP